MQRSGERALKIEGGVTTKARRKQESAIVRWLPTILPPGIRSQE